MSDNSTPCPATTTEHQVSSPSGSVLVTGATGLIGSAICAELRQRDLEVRALVRPGSNVEHLEAVGVHVVRGDITTADDVRSAAAGCEFAIHTAALVVGGPVYPRSDYVRTNVFGSRNVFEAARLVGMTRVISFTTGVPDIRRTAPPPGGFPGDPYLDSKLEVARDIVARSAAGQDIVELSPGAAFGPAPSGPRAVTAPGFNSRIILAIRGDLTEMPRFVTAFNLATDVARTSVDALTSATGGERYDLGSRLDDEVDTVTFLNAACERARVAHRVRPLTDHELESSIALERFGPSVIGIARRWRMGERTAPSPARRRAFDVLGHAPEPVLSAIDETVDWMLSRGLV
jgi:dihydroflavonol-4-reductase